MPFEIENQDLKDLQELVDNAKIENYDTYKKLYDGDHYRGGSGWVGPKPKIEDLEGVENASEILRKFNERIQKQFVSKNVVKEVVGRHVNGVLSRKSDIQLVPKEGEAGEDSEPDEEKELLEDQLRTWMRDQKVLDAMQEALAEALVGESSMLRIFIPAGLADENGILPAPEDMEDALSYIHVEAIDADQATMYIDPETMIEYGIYSYTDEDDNDKVEVSWWNPEDQLTYIRVIDTDGTEEGEGYQLHGRLTMFDVSREVMLSDQIVQNQDLLNKNLTMWSANLDWSGFTERMILNGMPPGEWTQNDETGTLEYEEQGQFVSGPAQTNHIFGHPKFNDEGQITGFTTPQVQFREPIDVETFDKTLGTTYRSILEEAKQAHILLNSEKTPSGISRREARQDYQNDLKDSKRVIDEAGEWIIEVAILLASDLLGQNTETEEYKASFSATLQIGALTSEEQNMIIEQVDNKLLSVETAMRKLGIDNIEGELDRIDSISEHMREIVEVMNEMGVQSPTLYRLIAQMLVRDKLDVFGEDIMSDQEISSIEGEVEQASQQNIQRDSFMSGLGDNPQEPEEQFESNEDE